jgi:hypothetical protein
MIRKYAVYVPKCLVFLMLFVHFCPCRFLDGVICLPSEEQNIMWVCVVATSLRFIISEKLFYSYFDGYIVSG